MPAEQEEPRNHADQPDRTAVLAAELAALRRALYGLIEALAWLALSAPVAVLILKVHLPEGFVSARIFDLSHALLSGLVALLVLRLSRRIFQPLSRRAVVHYGIAIMIAAAVGASIEVVQKFTHGDPSLMDLARDVIGALSALACAMSVDKTIPWTQRPIARWSLRLAALAALLRLAQPVVHITWQLHERAASFPRLADFESGAERDFVYVGFGAKLVQVAPADGFTLARGHVGQVTFAAGNQNPKLEIAAVGDWSKSHSLAFDVYSDAQSTIRLLVRIDDHQNRQFNTSLMIPPGQSTQRIPIDDVRAGEHGDGLDLAHMKAVLLFMWEPGETTILAFDSIRLEM